METTQSFRASALAALVTGCAALTLLSTSSVGAAPAPDQTYIQNWSAIYPNSQTDDNILLGTGSICFMCHSGAQGGNGWNGYGWNLRQNIFAGLTIDQAILAVEPLDSDMDPAAADNLLEILSDVQPGWTDGPHNTHYFVNGSQTDNNLPPNGILGDLDPPAAPADFCFGDGSGTACPCANHSAGGNGEGCANSSAAGGLLSASGSTSSGADDLAFDASNLLPAQPALLFVGNAPGSVRRAAGAGWRNWRRT